MAPETNFKSMSFNPFLNNSNFSDGNQDLDVNFFLDNMPSLNTTSTSTVFLRKNFEDFKELYKTLNLKFSIVCFSETMAEDDKLENDSLIQLPGYSFSHQMRKNCRDCGISIFVHKSLSFKIR